MPFDLKSQGHATRLVPSSLQITQSASQLSLFLTRKRKWKEERDKQRGEKQRPRIGFGNGARFAIVNPFALQFSHHKTLTSQRKIESRENSFLSLLPNN